MPRTDSLRNYDDDDVWARSAPAADRDLSARDGEPALSVANGYGAIYSEDGGAKISREQLNEMFHRLMTLVAELNKHGVFEWHAGGTYDHPCIATWGGVLYISKQDAPANQRPDLDFARVYWERVAPLASDSVPGLVELATDAETDAASTSSSATDLHVTNLRQAARLVTRLVAALVPANTRLPTPSNHTGQYLAGNRTWRALRDELAGLLLPATAGAAGTVLLGDKTFGTVPSRYTREELTSGHGTFNPADTVTTSLDFQYKRLGSGYNVNDWDRVEMYIGSPDVYLNYTKTYTWAEWSPENIPVETIGPQDAAWVPVRGRFVRGNIMRVWAFDEDDADRPEMQTWSISKTSAGLIQLQFLHQTHFDHPTSDWFGFGAPARVKYGVYGIRY